LSHYEEFDKVMSQICECAHVRGEHDWCADKFKQECLDDNCDCQMFKESDDPKVIEKHNDIVAKQLEQDERARYG